jgi:hypothetical protein
MCQWVFEGYLFSLNFLLFVTRTESINGAQHTAGVFIMISMFYVFLVAIHCVSFILLTLAC